MSLPSLCSAIRSQLYFSQISAWCDLIKKSDKSIYDTGRIIYHTATGAAGDLATSSANSSSAPTPLIPPHSSLNSTDSSNSPSPGTSPNVAAFGLLTSTTTTSATTSNLNTNRKPRLNIFYRIKQYDTTACFKSKPNVHNFPNVNISENCSIAVCLKSLPRINGGIPKIGTNMPSGCDVSVESNATTSTTTAFNSTKRENFSNSEKRNSTQSYKLPASTGSHTNSSSSKPLNCDNQMTATSIGLTDKHQQSNQNNKQTKTMFFIDDEELPFNNNRNSGGCQQDHDDIDGDGDGDTQSTQSSTNDSFSGSSNLSHREKQLMKYRKHIQKRDKKRERKSTNSIGDDELATTTSSQHQPMEQSGSSPPNKMNCSLSVGGGDVSHIEMISTGTQTPLTCCQQCGSEKTLLCLNCRDDLGSMSVSVNNEMDSSCSISSSDIIHTPRNKAELLLQAIQRTPKAAKQKHTNILGMNDAGNSLNNNHAANGSVSLSSSSTSLLSRNSNGCHECKRQKTQHNYATSASAPISSSMAADYTSVSSLEEFSNGKQQQQVGNISPNEDEDDNDDSDGGTSYQENQINVSMAETANNLTVIEQSAYSSMEQVIFFYYC